MPNISIYLIGRKEKLICCEMLPGNTVSVKSPMPMAEQISQRFGLRTFYIVIDRGMITLETLTKFESRQPKPYISLLAQTIF
jgi:hypothetical protein